MNADGVLALHGASGPFAAAAPPLRPWVLAVDAGALRHRPLDPSGDALAAWAGALDGGTVPIDRHALSWLLHASLGCSAVKEGPKGRYALWCNPTSGNLHTVEADVVVDGGEHAGLHRYDSLHHALYEMAPCSDERDPSAIHVALSLMYGRQVWKYGLRGVRYAWIDLGHAIAAVEIAASSLGWRVETVRSPALEEGLGWRDRTSAWDPGRGEVLRITPAGGLARALPRFGAFARRSSSTPELLDFERASEWIRASEEAPPPARRSERAADPVALALAQRRRRSADVFTRDGVVSSAAFRGVLDSIPATAALEVLVFVHRVADVPRGIYRVTRRSDGTLHRAAVFVGDVEEVSVGLHAYQPAAQNHAFSITFGLPLEAALAGGGIGTYRGAHVEAGAIAQRLYLAAQSNGLVGTGIGALLDEELEAFPDLRGWAPLYAFACGTA